MQYVSQQQNAVFFGWVMSVSVDSCAGAHPCVVAYHHSSPHHSKGGAAYSWFNTPSLIDSPHSSPGWYCFFGWVCGTDELLSSHTAIMVHMSCRRLCAKIFSYLAKEWALKSLKSLAFIILTSQLHLKPGQLSHTEDMNNLLLWLILTVGNTRR